MGVGGEGFWLVVDFPLSILRLADVPLPGGRVLIVDLGRALAEAATARSPNVLLCALVKERSNPPGLIHVALRRIV